MRIKSFLQALFSAIVIFTLAGCAAKEQATREVYVPVRCNLKMPLRPAAGESFEAHRALMSYLLKCEQIARDCTEGEL